MDSLCILIEFRKLLQIAVITFISVIFSGCEKNDVVASAKYNKIDFDLKILNEQDIEAASFEHGTDIKFALKLTNNSNQDFEWNYHYPCELLNSEDFLLVYQFIQGDDSNAYYLPVGKPYLSPINCLMINLPPQRIPPGENLVIKLSWSDNPDNEPLKIGKYFTVSNLELKSNEVKRKWDLRTDFEIF